MILFPGDREGYFYVVMEKFDDKKKDECYNQDKALYFC